MDALAAVISLSRHHFIRRFHAAAGAPPMRWLCELRLTTGRHLLATTDLKVEEIGRRVGYPDSLLISRAMRQHTGRSPMGWRLP